jgi:hypothetical protein
MLINSTWNTFKEVVPHETYIFNSQRSLVRFLNGSEVILTGLDATEELDRFSSTELALICIDQAEEVEQSHYVALITRLRQRLPDGTFPPYKILVSANPKVCYLKDRFILNPIVGKREFFPFRAKNNTKLPPDYIDRLKDALKDLPAMYSALVEGSWDIIEDNDAIISYSKIELASKRRKKLAYFDKRLVSIDVAREGDDLTCIYGWDGAKVAAEEIYGKKDLDVTAYKGVAMLNKLQANCIIWDADGIGGGLRSNLKNIIPTGTELIEFHGMGKSTDERYFNQRAQAWFEAAELFNNDLISIPDDPVLVGELASIKFEYRLGKLIVEAKTDVKKRLSKSPDRADAIVYGIYGLKRAKSMYIEPEVKKGTMAELISEIDNEEEEKDFKDYIGNHNSEKW